MIMICERCYAPVGNDEPVLRLAHIAHARADGDVQWRHSYVHTGTCAAPRTAPHRRPDPGEWNASRSVGWRRS